MGNSTSTLELPVAIDSPTWTLTEEEANAIFEQGREAVVFVILKLAKERAELANKLLAKESVSTPSGMVPIYQKQSVNRRAKSPGCKKGHDGNRRAKAVKIDRQQEHQLNSCPGCGGKISPKPSRKRTRIIEDIPEVEPEVTEHTIYGYYCNSCRKIVEPVVKDALPGSTIGNNLLVLTAWLHYGLGQTLSQIVTVLNFHLQFQISEGGLVQMWRRLQEILYAWYEQIGEQAKKAAIGALVRGTREEVKKDPKKWVREHCDRR